MKTYYFNNIQVSFDDYKALYKRHYRRGVDIPLCRMLKKKYYCTSTNYPFEVKTI